MSYKDDLKTFNISGFGYPFFKSLMNERGFELSSLRVLTDTFYVGTGTGLYFPLPVLEKGFYFIVSLTVQEDQLIAAPVGAAVLFITNYLSSGTATACGICLYAQNPVTPMVYNNLVTDSLNLNNNSLSAGGFWVSYLAVACSY